MVVVMVTTRSCVVVKILFDFLIRLYCFLLWTCVVLIWNVWGYGLVLFRWMLGWVVVLSKIGDVYGYPKWRRAYPKIVLCWREQNWRVGKGYSAQLLWVGVGQIDCECCAARA